VTGAARAACLLVALPALAQEVELRTEQTDLLNFAFASQVGSGVYAVDGRTVQIYRIPVDMRLRSVSDDPRRWGLKLTLPVTLGFYDFAPRDVVTSGLPEEVGTLSLVPGVQLEVPVGSSWELAPFAEAGVAQDFESGTSTAVYALGLESEYTFAWSAVDGRLGNRLLWAGITGGGALVADDYGELETGLELTHALWFAVAGHPADAGLFAASYLYFNPLEGLGGEADRFEMQDQWEIGITFGTRPPLAYKKLRAPRIGASYRFGDGISAARLVLGAAF
jgi:hypothetical protein